MENSSTNIIQFNDPIRQMKQAVEEQVEVEKLEYLTLETTAPKQLTATNILSSLEANEDGDSWLLTYLSKGQYCYDHSEGQWYQFNGNHWEQDIINNAIKAIDQVVEIYGQEVINQANIRKQAASQGDPVKQKNAEKLEDILLKRISALRTLKRKQHILQLAAFGSDSLGIIGNEWDCNPWLLACANGVIDLKSGHFREGRPDDYIKTAAPTEWLGIDTPAPRWQQFLEEIFEGNQELVNFMQRLFGCAIIGEVIEHIFPIFWGRGRNGKGTILETIKSVLDDLAGPLSSESLMEQKFTRSGSAPSPDMMSLRGRRIAWSSETDEGRRFNMAKVKALVGGDSISARQVYGKHQVEFTPSHTLFLLTNDRPGVNADDYAAWERIYLIPFNLSYVDKPKAENERQKDGELKEKLLQEAPGILAWLVRGCLLYQAEKLNPPDIVNQATQEYRHEVDDYGHFIDDYCVLFSNATVRAADFYKAYKKWCEENGSESKSNKKFGGNMVKRFKRENDYRGNYYSGVGLREEAEEPLGGLDVEDNIFN